MDSFFGGNQSIWPNELVAISHPRRQNVKARSVQYEARTDWSISLNQKELSTHQGSRLV